MLNKRFESSASSIIQSSSHLNKFSMQICNILSSGNTEELEKFLSKNENLNYEILAKALFSSIKDKRITVHQSEILQILFSRYPIVNLTDENEKTLLIYGAINLDESLISILLEYSANANYYDKERKTALYYAMDQDYENMHIIENLKSVTDLNIENPNSMSFLHLAIKKGHINILASLLDQGSNVDQIQKTTGDTALHFAMKTRNFKAIKMLIEKNASLSLKNKQNKTAIDLALDEDLKNFIQEIQNQKKINESEFDEISTDNLSESKEKFKNQQNNENFQKLNSQQKSLRKTSSSSITLIPTSSNSNDGSHKKIGPTFQTNFDPNSNNISHDLRVSFPNQQSPFAPFLNGCQQTTNNFFHGSNQNNVYPQNQINFMQPMQNMQDALNPNNYESNMKFMNHPNNYSSQMSNSNFSPQQNFLPNSQNLMPGGFFQGNQHNQHHGSSHYQNEPWRNQKFTRMANNNNGNMNNNYTMQPQNLRKNSDPNQRNHKFGPNTNHNTYKNYNNPGRNSNNPGGGYQNFNNNGANMMKNTTSNNGFNFPQNQINYNNSMNMSNDYKGGNMKPEDANFMDLKGNKPQNNKKNNSLGTPNWGEQTFVGGENSYFIQTYIINSTHQFTINNNNATVPNFFPVERNNQSSPHLTDNNPQVFGNFEQMNQSNSIPMNMENNKDFFNQNRNFNNNNYNNQNPRNMGQNSMNNYSSLSNNNNMNRIGNKNRYDNRDKYRSRATPYCDNRNRMFDEKNILDTNSKNNRLDPLEEKRKEHEHLLHHKMELEKRLNAKKQKIFYNNNSSDLKIYQNKYSDTSDLHLEEISECFSSQKNVHKNFLLSEEICSNLHIEIVKFSTEVEEFNERNKSLFKDLIEKISEAIQKVLPDSVVSTYGSFETGLCLPYSDIDLVVQQSSFCAYADPLSVLEDSIKSKSWIQETKNIKSALIPVLKVVCSKEYQNKRLDISIKESNHNGLKCVNFINESLCKYESLKPLILVLKHFLYSSNFSDPYSGGLSSYGLILMIVSFLKKRLFYKMNCDKKAPNLGILLIEFLKLYSEFNFNYYFIDPKHPVDPSFPFQINPMVESGMILLDRMVVIDPLNNQNNVARSTFNINEIKKAFLLSLHILHENYICSNISDESHTYIYNFIEEINPKIEKKEKEKEEIKTTKPPCCLLKRLFQLPKQFFEKTFKLANKIEFVK